MLYWSHNTCHFISHITQHIEEKKEPEISERIIEGHKAVTEAGEVVLRFIDVVNTTVSSTVAGNSISLRKKVTYWVPCIGLSNSLKINHLFLSTAMK